MIHYMTLLLICRTIVDTINEAHLKYNECLVPLNRGDDMRSKALLREVEKVDPQVNSITREITTILTYISLTE